MLRAAGSPAAFRRRLAPGAAPRQGGEYGNGQIKPREPQCRQPDATTLYGSTCSGVTAQPALQHRWPVRSRQAVVAADGPTASAAPRYRLRTARADLHELVLGDRHGGAVTGSTR
jgi:hypothetical protein